MIILIYIFFTVISQVQGVLETFFQLRCNQSTYFPIFFGLSIGYKFILHAIALMLACLSRLMFCVRKLKVDVLNDSRETVGIIYGSNIVLMVITLVLLTGLNQSGPPDAINIIWSILVFTGGAIHIGLTFIPKV